LAITLLSDLVAGWLVRYVAAEFAWLKLIAFWSVQGLSLVLLGGLLWSFQYSGKQQSMDAS
jgi:hypothetical protein